MDELIALLERYSTIPNEGESFEDIVKSYDKIIEILKQYAEIKQKVEEYHRKTTKEKPIETTIELQMDLKALAAHQRCLANQVLDIVDETN